MHPLHSLASTILLTGFCLAQAWNASGPGLRYVSDVFYDPVHHETVLFGTADRSGLVDPGDFTWLWNGANWTRSTATSAPPTLTFQGCYADAQQRYVALANTSPATTWSYGGTDWTQVPTAHVPPTRNSAGIAYDQARQRVVLFGGWSQFGLANDTWEFDGVDWHSVGSLPAPPPRSGPAMGFDAARNRLVLHGGRNQLGLMVHDTWEWVGGAWQQVATANWPPSTLPLVWYPPRQRLVQFAGTVGFEFTGTDWQSFATPAPGPFSPLRVWDTGRQRLVQVGRRYDFGYNTPSLCDEVWEQSGAAWQPIVQGPPQRVEAALASDFVRGELVLYDGQQAWQRLQLGWAAHAPGAPQLSAAHIAHDPARDRFLVHGLGAGTAQLWALQGTSWTRLTPAHLPPNDMPLVLAFDSARRVLVGHSDYSFPNQGAGVTWEYDGSDWRTVTTPTAPGSRYGFAMVFDAGLGACVLYGGRDTSLTPLADTWLYDGTGWQQRFTAHGPPGLQDHAMAYDPWRGRTVLHGGYDGYNTLFEFATWEFDGIDWRPLPTTGERIQRRRHALAIDPLRGTTVAVGGTASFSNNFPAEPRTFDLLRPIVATVARYGPGCAPAGSAPTLDAAPGSAPLRGSTLVLTVDTTTAPAGSFLALGFRIDRWQGKPLPAALDALGLPGCKLWLAAEPSLGSFAPHQGPIGSHLLPLPLDPALAGTHFAAQAVVFDADPSHTALSNAVLVTVQ